MQLTPHATERALEMGVTGEEIRLAFERPLDRYWSAKHRKWTYRRGRIALGVDESGRDPIVCTVVWSEERYWRADQARGGTTDRVWRDNYDHLRPRRKP